MHLVCGYIFEGWPKFREYLRIGEYFAYFNEFLSGSDKAYFVDLFVRASNTAAIKMYEKVGRLYLNY